MLNDDDNVDELFIPKTNPLFTKSQMNQQGDRKWRISFSCIIIGNMYN